MDLLGAMGDIWVKVLLHLGWWPHFLDPKNRHLELFGSSRAAGDLATVSILFELLETASAESIPCHNSVVVSAQSPVESHQQSIR